MTNILRADAPLFQHENHWLASYAMKSADSIGRVHPEAAHPYRSPFQRDRDRIVHSSAFRRLAHKTQVFTGEMGDYHRTRLTHTMEVASIARTLGRALRLNEDLIESLALLHDVGHPPFGHAGEDVLDDCLRDHGGFNHNRQALRLAELLEIRYPEFPGLNLSHEVLAGQRLHSLRSEARQSARNASPEGPVPSEGDRFARRHMLLEMQVVDAADSIAYDTHDVDDALEMGLLELEQLLDVPIWREAASRVQRRYSALRGDSLRRAIVHQLIETLVSDLLSATQNRLDEAGITSIDTIRRHRSALAVPSTEIAEQKRELEHFLFTHVYRHPTVLERRQETSQALWAMFRDLVSRPERLPAHYLQQTDQTGIPRGVVDFLASMTDRFALETLEKMQHKVG